MCGWDMVARLETVQTGWERVRREASMVRSGGERVHWAIYMEGSKVHVV